MKLLKFVASLYITSWALAAILVVIMWIVDWLP